MKIYWTLKSIPELRQLSWRERGRRWRRAYHKSLQHTPTLAALLICGLCAGLGGYIGSRMEMGMLGAMLGGGLGGFIFGQVVTIVARKHYRHILLGEEPQVRESQSA